MNEWEWLKTFFFCFFCFCFESNTFIAIKDNLHDYAYNDWKLNEEANILSLLSTASWRGLSIL